MCKIEAKADAKMQSISRRWGSEETKICHDGKGGKALLRML